MLELIFVALLILLGWGVEDFFIAALAKKANPYLVNFWNSFIAATLLAAVYFVFFFPRTVPKGDWWLVAVYAAVVIAAFLSFLKALKAGKVSLISPITSSYGILAMLLSLVFLNEVLKLTQYIGIFLATAGLLLAIADFSGLKMLRLKSEVKGLKYAAIAFVAWGIAFTVAARFVRDVDWITPFFFTSIITVPAAFFIAFRYGKVRKFRDLLIGKKQFALLILGSVFLEAAWLFYLFSLRRFPSALLAPISAAYPALTILLAHFFFKERMAKIQYAGVGMILAGLVVAAL